MVGIGARTPHPRVTEFEFWESLKKNSRMSSEPTDKRVRGVSGAKSRAPAVMALYMNCVLQF